jgi:hypothetical protein
LVEACFGQLLATAAAIADPFEQSFFVMVDTDGRWHLNSL